MKMKNIVEIIILPKEKTNVDTKPSLCSPDL